MESIFKRNVLLEATEEELRLQREAYKQGIGNLDLIDETEDERGEESEDERDKV